jgi:hypothetical protein
MDPKYTEEKGNNSVEIDGGDIVGLDETFEPKTIGIKFKESDYIVNIDIDKVKCSDVLRTVVESNKSEKYEEGEPNFVYDLGHFNEFALAKPPYKNMEEDIRSTLDFLKFWFEKQDPSETAEDQYTTKSYTAFGTVKKPICSIFIVKPNEDSPYYEVFKKNSHLYNEVLLEDEKTKETRPFDYEIGMRLMTIRLPVLNAVLCAGGHKLLCWPLAHQAAAAIAIGLKGKFKKETVDYLKNKRSIFDSIINDELSQTAKEEIAEFKRLHNINI